MTMRMVLRVFALRPWPAVWATALYTIYSCVPLLTGWLQQLVYDVASGETAVGLNLSTLLVLLLASRLSDALSLMVWYPVNWGWFFQMFSDVRERLLAAILRGNHTSLVPGPTLTPGQEINRFEDDVEEVVDVVNEYYRIVSQGTMAVIAIAILYQVDPRITLFSVIPLSLIVLVTHTLNAAIARRYGAVREEDDRVSGFLGEIFGAALALKLAGATEAATGRLERLGDRRRQAVMGEQLLSAAQDLLEGIITHGKITLVLILGAAAMATGDMTVGELAMFVTYLGELMEFPRRIGRLLAQQRTAGVSAHRLGDMLPADSEDESATQRADRVLLDRDPVVMDVAPSTPPVFRSLDVHGLTCRYGDNGPGIEAAQLQVRAGELVVITGRVASGKSTLLKGLLGLLPCQAGQILWNGAVVQPSDLRPPRVAYTPQVPRLFSETLQENVLLGLQDDGVLQQALSEAVMEADVARLADGVQTVVGPRGVRLSGGQVQRTAAARMFARGAQLLVVDDLSSALDVETEAALWIRVGRLREKGVACLAVTHRRPALRQADRIVVLDGGWVVDTGTLHELLDRCAALQEVWGEG
jgi:ATP-binding cassette, subfamily B, bacterial